MTFSTKMVIALVIGVGFADERATIDKLLTLVPSKREMAMATLKLLPANQRQGIQDYIGLTGITAFFGENKGFKKYNQEYLGKNQCVENLAAEFYASINNDDLEQIIKTKSSVSKFVNLKMGIEEIGEKPGWLWKKALEISNGDRLLAMQIIGICGHDDKMQLESKMRLGNNASVVTSKVTEREIKEYVFAQNLSVEQKADLLDNLKERVNFSNGVMCPFALSKMYYPQALGENADISPETRKIIADIQAPTLGPAKLPGKNYHVIGAAYAACHLVRRNLPNFLSEKIVKGAINGYRAGRLCPKLSTRNLGIPELKNLSYNKLITIAQNVRAHDDLCFNKLPKPWGELSVVEKMDLTVSEGSKQAQNRKDCFVTKILSNDYFRDQAIPDKILQEKLARAIAERDIAEMFVHSPQFSESNECSGPQLNESVVNFLRRAIKSNSCAKDLDPIRCKNAIEVMKTYLVDFDWSEQQHLAGLKFAEKNCPNITAGKPPELVACEILEKRSGAGSSKPGVR